MLRGSLLVLLSRNLQKVSAALVFFLIGLRLGPTGVGVYGLLVTVQSNVGAICTFGVGQAHVYLRGQRLITPAQILGNALAGTAIFGAGSIAIFLAALPYLRFDFATPAIVLLVSLSLPVMLLQNLLDHFWLGEGRVGLYSGLYVVRFVALPALVLLALWLPDTRQGMYVGLAGALLAGNLLGVVVGLYVVRRLYGLRPRWDRGLFRRAVRYGVDVQAGTVAQTVGYRFDVFLINGYLGAAPTGLYGMATRFSEILWLVPTAIATSLVPRVSHTDRPAARRVTARSCRLVFSVGVVSAAGVYVLGPPALQLVFGDEFDGSVAPLRILLVGVTMLSLQRVLASYFIGQGEAKWFQRATLLSMAVNVGLNVWLIPLPAFGINGAALASTVSYSLSTAILVALFVRERDYALRDLLLPTKGDARDVSARFGVLRRRVDAAKRQRRLGRSA